MRKVILGVAVSLDGFIEGPNGEYDWCFTDQDYGLKDFMKRIDAIFFGRKSYDLVLTTEPANNPWKNMKSYVFSNTMKETEKDFEIVSGDIRQAVDRIKNEKGKDIWLFGGASLTTSLMNARLVDEVWLAVHPILLGKGKPLFTGIDGRIKTKLTNSKIYSTGLVSLWYDVEK